METKVIVISPTELSDFLQPILQRLEKIEAYLTQKDTNSQRVFTEAEAAEFLKCSTKKLQNLRNCRKIGYIRENDGRKILYTIEHVLEYLAINELKRKK
jgi:hypothetical protein